jgi:hypothetical protein
MKQFLDELGVALSYAQQVISTTRRTGSWVKLTWTLKKSWLKTF